MSRKRFSPNTGPSQRQLRAGQLVRAVLVEILDRKDTANPLLDNASITIGEVRMSPDLKHATAFVSPFGNYDDAHKQKIINALEKNIPKIQRELGKKISLKFTPNLRFLSDTSYDEALHIDRLLHSIKNNNKDG